jgi:hypothetical protein
MYKGNENKGNENKGNDLDEEDLDEDFDNIDSSWLEEFDNIDKEYKDYYTSDLTHVKTQCIYVNKDNEIDRIIEDSILLNNPGILSKEETIGFIKHNAICNQVKYSLLYILKYNINLDPINLKTFMRNRASLVDIGAPFLQSVKHIDAIKFDKSISMFHDLNELFIIFYNKAAPITHHNRHHNRSGTRRIYINSSSFKKTKRNIFKDNLS